MTAVATSTSAAKRIRLLLALTLAATALSLAALPTHDASASSDTKGHKFSDPNWYPLRNSGDTINSWRKDPNPDPREWSGLVGCVKDNCDPYKDNDPHGVWAIDWIADEGDPVFAAGSGILHVGANPPPCQTSGVARDGKWVWIDHGGGVTSRYHHLDTITAKEGQLVTPFTRIGTVGSTGKACGGTEKYLHFQIRRGGISGNPQPLLQLRACDFTTGDLVLYPRYLPRPDRTKSPDPFENWDQVPYRNINGAVPRTSDVCIPAIAETPERLPQPSGGPGKERALIRWGDPVVHPGSGAADSIVISRLTWRPSKNNWGDERWTRLSNEDARSHLFTGLINGRKYRYRVAYHNRVGHGNWSPWKEIKVGAAPDAPTKRRMSTGPRRINFGWYKPDHNGYPVTGYQVGIRRLAGGSWGPWDTTYQRLAAGSYKVWEGLRTKTVYQVRVRADSGVGFGPWSPKYRAVTGS